MVMMAMMAAVMVILLSVCWNYGPNQNDKSDGGKENIS